MRLYSFWVLAIHPGIMGYLSGWFSVDGTLRLGQALQLVMQGVQK
jgi:hypothetical protein